VLEFYDRQPFNYYGSVAQQAAAVRSRDPVDSYPVLAPLLVGGQTRVFDVGCGVGWLSNGIALRYRRSVIGIDASVTAIARARAVATTLETDARFEVADLFDHEPDLAAELAISIGVLHHTDDFGRGVRRLFEVFTAPGGHAFLGLYHAYARRPFHEHFTELRSRGLDEDELFARYQRLDRRHDDKTHARSWFRDQVLNPHESHHTLAELLPLLAECGMELVATSINQFAPPGSLAELLEQEKGLERVGRERLAAGRFFPGFFFVLVRKQERLRASARKSLIVAPLDS
jgi:SAM-dependent methyltransferase